MAQAVTSFQFMWNGQKYRVDMPDVTSMIVLPNNTPLMVEKCVVRVPTAKEKDDVIGKDLPRAESLK